ncbi:MAG TPA: alpha/beta fold hydrolase [Pyrinomonadaceae bacterium]
MQTGFAELGGARFYYEMAGEGEPLVLAHAGICDCRMWDEQFRAFAESYQVLRYDRRGFGRTETEAVPFSHHEDLSGLLKFFQLERPLLLGCSQGGKTVLDLALEHPGTARALVLVASAVSGFNASAALPQQWAELLQADERGDVERVGELELQIWVDGPRRSAGQVDALLRERVREMNLVALKRASGLGTEQAVERGAAERLEEISVPTLVVIGELDTPRTLEAADLLAEKIEGAKKILIPGAAHLPNMEQPGLFNREVLAFLKSLS